MFSLSGWLKSQDTIHICISLIRTTKNIFFFYFENGGGLLEIFQINNVLRGFLVKMCNNFSHGVKGYETWGVSDET